MNKRNSIYKTLFIGILFSFILQSCSSDKATESQAQAEEISDLVSLSEAQEENIGLNFTQLEERKISTKLRLNGKIEVPPQNLVSISIPFGGYLRSTEMLPGTSIKKGQVIALIEDQKYIQMQQDYLLAKVQLKTLETEFERQKLLNQSKATSDKIAQKAEAEYQQAKINLKALEESLRLIGIQPQTLSAEKIKSVIPIASPIDGYVSTVNANIGKYLTSTDVLFELVNVTDIHLNLIAFEKDITSLAIGQKVVAFTNESPEKKYNCEIILVGHSLSNDKSTEIHCHFEKYDPKLIPGMYMNAEVALVDKPTLVLTNDAIVAFEDKKFVFIETKVHTYKMIEVKIGIQDEKGTEIINKTALEGKKIVNNGAYDLLMKLKNSEEEE